MIDFSLTDEQWALRELAHDVAANGPRGRALRHLVHRRFVVGYIEATRRDAVALGR